MIKPGTEEMEGCACVPDIASLPEPVDLLVLAIGAEQVPAALEEIDVCPMTGAGLGVSGAFDAAGNRLFMRTNGLPAEAGAVDVFTYDSVAASIGVSVVTVAAQGAHELFGVDQLAVHPGGSPRPRSPRPWRQRR